MRIGVFTVLLALFLSAGAALAGDGRGGVEPLDRILSHMRNEHPGTFYDADGPFTDENGGVHYRIKWLTPQGRLIWFDTDAHTGRVLGVDRGHMRGGAFPGGDRRDPPPRERFDNDQGHGYNNFPGGNFPHEPHWHDDRGERHGPHGGGR
jgi:hypothetical protein